MTKRHKNEVFCRAWFRFRFSLVIDFLIILVQNQNRLNPQQLDKLKKKNNLISLPSYTHFTSFTFDSWLLTKTLSKNCISTFKSLRRWRFLLISSTTPNHHPMKSRLCFSRSWRFAERSMNSYLLSSTPCYPENDLRGTM